MLQTSSVVTVPRKALQNRKLELWYTLIYSVIFWSICWQTKITILQKKWIFCSCQAGIWTLPFRIQYPQRSTLALAHSKRNMVSQAGRQELVVWCQSKLGKEDTHHLEYIFLTIFCVSIFFFQEELKIKFESYRSYFRDVIPSFHLLLWALNINIQLWWIDEFVL